ncbi:hypothetical protein [Nocardia nova]|uniref:hypothetical protein n=1 Tax=Nocardia nova TaxID=37330 RepID=UPI0033FE46EE
MKGAKRSRAPAPPARGSRGIRVLPGGTHAKEIYAGAVLAVLAILATTGWITASSQPAPAPATPSAEPPEAYEFAANSIYTGSITGATALILIGLIAGAAIVGMLVYAPKRDDRTATPGREGKSGKHVAAAAPESANRREVCERPVIRPGRPVRSSRPSSRIRRCSSTSSDGR